MAASLQPFAPRRADLLPGLAGPVTPSIEPWRIDASSIPPLRAPIIATQAGSPLGLRAEPLRVHLDAPSNRTTSQSSFVISGRISGEKAPERLTLVVNEVAREIVLDGSAFESLVTLTPGLNRIRAAVAGPNGVQSDDTLVIEYSPKASAIRLIAPRDGLTLGQDDPLALLVEGTVEDTSATTVWLVFNGQSIPVFARQGRFRHFVPIVEPTVRVWAESRTPDGESLRSSAITVTRTHTPPRGGVLILAWPDGAGIAPLEVNASWRGVPGRLDAPSSPVTLSRLGDASTPSSAAFSVSDLRSGVYTFTMRFSSPPPAVDLNPTFYFSDTGGVKHRTLKQQPAPGDGRVTLARILLPQGVQWDDDRWFTGKSESVEAISKFRFPEGITWTERKSDLR